MKGDEWFNREKVIRDIDDLYNAIEETGWEIQEYRGAFDVILRTSFYDIDSYYFTVTKMDSIKDMVDKIYKNCNEFNVNLNTLNLIGFKESVDDVSVQAALDESESIQIMMDILKENLEQYTIQEKDCIHEL